MARRLRTREIKLKEFTLKEEQRICEETETKKETGEVCELQGGEHGRGVVKRKAG
jgi:hypothetical protein